MTVILSYNATLTYRRDVNPELMVIRVRPDQPIRPLQAGQFTTLGLGYWEPRVPDCDAEVVRPEQAQQIVQRAYSISSRILDDNDRPVCLTDSDELEFYIVLIRHSDGRPPALTPRLFGLQPGSRLHIGEHAKGHFTLDRVQPTDDVIFLSTGTGEAPHNALLGELLARGHQGRIVNLVAVRQATDLGYLATHERVAALWPQYVYEPRISRSAEAASTPKPRLQELIQNGAIAERLGHALDPSRCHVFLCGNPGMVGAPHDEHGKKTYPQPQGCVEVLERLGFTIDHPWQPGNIHFERYW